MALALYDRVQQTGTANTTVSFTLSGSVTGFQSFAVVGNGNTTYYSAFDASGNWETGLGTYSTTGPTLTRTTIYQSSNSNAAVTFSGTVNIFVTYPSGRSVNLDASGNASSLGTPASFVGTNITGTASGLSIGGNAATATTATTAGSVTNALTISSPLTGSSYNGASAVSIGIPAATTSVNGYLTATDWNTFNGKASAVTYTTNYVPYGQGTTTPAQSSSFTFDGTTQAAPVMKATQGFYINPQTNPSSYIVPASTNAMTAGPFTVATGTTITVSTGSRWVVL